MQTHRILMPFLWRVRIDGRANKAMSKKSLVKLLLPSILFSVSTQALAYNINEAVATTLATSPDFLITTNTRDLVDKQLRQSYGAYLPTVDMNAGLGQQYANNLTTRALDPLTRLALPGGSETLTRTEFGLLANQMIWDGLAVFHDVAGHKSRVRAESWRVNGSAQDIALGAIEAFLDVILNRELVELAKINLEAHERLYGQIQKRSEGGIGRKADLDQAQARLALARTNKMAQVANLEDANTQFLRTIGMPTPKNLEAPRKPHPFPVTQDEAVDIGLCRHPVLQASVEDVDVTRQAWKGSRSSFSPRVDLQLGFNHNHNVDGALGGSDDASAMLRLQWNLFNGGRDLARICETAYQMQEAQEVQNRAHRQVIETVRLAWNSYATAKRQLPYLKEHVDASTRTRDAYYKQFQIGQRTLLDLLDSENELFGARTSYATGKNTLMVGMYRVMNATGQLTEYLNVDLPRQAEPKPTGIMDGAFGMFHKSSDLFD